MLEKNDSRYSGNASLAFDRAPHIPERRRTPSPIPAGNYPFYDRYTSPRAGPSYRESYPNNYRSEAWRPERPHNGTTPSDRHISPRSNEIDSWDRSAWRSPEVPSWTDRRPSQSTTYETGWSRPRRDTMAQPMFEPSDNWKQTHAVNPEYQEGSSKDHIYDNYPENSPIRDRSPERSERSFRGNHSPPYPSANKFRRFSPVQEYREPYTYSNPRTDTHRPAYNDRNAWSPPKRYPADQFSGNLDGRPREYSRPTATNVRLPRSPIFVNDRIQVARERSVSGGSGYDGSLRSPIRTRTNLPDRVTFNTARSVSNSDAYQHHNTTKPHSRTPSDSYFLSHRKQQQQQHSRSSSHSSHIGRAQGELASPTRAYTDRQATSDRTEFRDVLPQQPSLAARIGGRWDAFAHQNKSFGHSASTETRPVDQDMPTKDNFRDMPTTINEAVESLSELQIQRSPVIQRPDTVDSQPAGGEPPRIHIIVPTELQPADEILSSQCPLDAQSPTSSREDSLEAEIPLAQQVKRNSMIHSTPSAPPTPAPGPSEPPSRGELHQPEPAPDIPLSEALRMVVAMRLQLDRQTQEERVDPVLRDNLSKVKSTPVPSHTSPEALVREVTSGERLISREATFETAKPSLQVRFALRQADLSDKVQRLKGEYLALHEQWRIHCGKLDDVARAMALQEAAATAGRTTRRSAATMGDAVRSDLEMEQIIASLGNEELTDANHLGARNAAVIPDMFTVSRGEIDYFFDDTNNEVQNPKEYYTPHTRMEDWTDEEIGILVEKFAECPKQFGTIARSLPNKTAAECVAFYYLHKHKHIDFRKVVARKQASKRRRGGRKQKSNALLADILKRDDEVHATDGSNRRKRTSVVPGVELRRGPRRNVILADHTPTGTPTPEPEAESRKRKRRIAVRTADSVEQDEVNEDVDMEPKAAKRGRRGRKPRNSSTPLSTPTISDDHLVIFAQEAKFVDQTEFSMRRKTAVGVTTWSNEDKATFLHLLSQHGDDFKRIAASMPNKTTIQVSTFYKANVVELGLEKIVAGAPKRSPSPDPSEMWRDAPFIGSGVITPSVSHSTTPGEGIPGLNNLSNFGPDSHVFPNGRASPSAFSILHSRDISGGTTPILGLSPHGSSHFRPTMESMRYYHNNPMDPSSRGYMPIQPHGNQQSISPHPGGRLSNDAVMSHMGSSNSIPLSEISNPSPFAASASAFASTFPFASLSPSSFAPRGLHSPRSDVRSTHSANSRIGERGAMDATLSRTSNPGMAFDTVPPFVPAPQAWTHAPLQTTEDLRAYLEHRTRLSGQQ